MVKVDTVYQRVLAIANKEQRGYITPQEINLYANQAQMDIFDQYFYDLNQFRRIPGNDTQYADAINILEEKIQVFELTDGPNIINDTSIYVGAGGGGINKILPDYIYRVNRIELNGAKCEIMNTQQFSDVKLAPLLKPTPTRPVVNIRKKIMRVNDGSGPVTPTGVKYIKKPTDVNWGYVVIDEKALYNATLSTDFELHPSEETKLVIKILASAGIMLKDPSVYQIASAEDNKNTTQEKS